MKVKSLSRVRLSDPMDCSLPGSSVHEIFHGKSTGVGCHCLLPSNSTNSIQNQFSSVHFSHSVMSYSLQPHGLQHARHPCPSPTPGVYSNSCPLSWWCHPTISSSVVPFSSHLQSFPASGSFQISQFFTSGG